MYISFLCSPYYIYVSKLQLSAAQLSTLMENMMEMYDQITVCDHQEN